MSTIVIDPLLKSKLHDLNEPVEVRDQDGRVLGRFLPEEDFRRMQYELAMAACPYSEEQLSRFRQEKSGISLDEFWKKMGVTT